MGDGQWVLRNRLVAINLALGNHKGLRLTLPLSASPSPRLPLSASPHLPTSPPPHLPTPGGEVG
ncbi:MAG: hypothetical protein AAFV72_20760, partial [Cyanobacteria bacterium J06635_1]